MIKEPTLDEISAIFEIAFRTIESDKFSVSDKLKQIDVFADYLFIPCEDDYTEEGINENSYVFIFIEKMIDNTKKCREIVIEELEKKEDYEMLSLVVEAVSKEAEAIIDNLNIF